MFAEACQAIDEGDLQTLKQLLERHPDLLKEQSEDGKSLSFWTLDWPGGKPGAAQSLELLLKHGADPNARFKGEGETLLHWAASLEHDADSIPVLVRRGANVDATGGVIDGATPLTNALHFAKMPAARELVKAGAWTDSLRIAVGLGRLEVAKAWCSDQGVAAQAAATLPQQECAGFLSDEEARNTINSAFDCAVPCGQFHCADWLLEKGAEIDPIRPGCDSTLLHQVARKGNLAAAHYLIARGADPNVVSNVRPAKPCHYGSAFANFEVMNFLIDSGSEITAKDAAYCGRLDKIVGLSSETDLELLEQTIGTRTPVGKPIHPQQMVGRRAVARFLLQRSPQHVEQAKEWATTAEDFAYLSFLGEEF